MTREDAKVRRKLAARLSWLLPVLGLLAGIVASPVAAHALPITVKVTVISFEDPDDDLDEGAPGSQEADFAGRVFIDGQQFDIPKKEEDDLYEINLTFQKDFDHTRTTPVPVSIVAVEDDGNLFNGTDDSVDLQPGGNDVLDFNVDLHLGNPCITGEVTGACNATELSSTGDRDDEEGTVKFKVEVTLPPTTLAGSHVRCTHSPIWPNSGDTVNITAESLGDQPASDPGNADLAAPMPAQLVPKVEVFVSPDGGATRMPVNSANNASSVVGSTTAGAAGTTLSYGCRVETAQGPIFSGWRSTTIGNPPNGGLVASLSVAESERKNALDIVLVPATKNALNNPFNPGAGQQAQNAYSGTSDADFLAEASRILKDEVFRHQVFLDGQRRINLWLLLDGGVAANQSAVGGTRDLLDNMGNVTPDANMDNIPDGDGTADVCHVEPPANAATDASWSNATALIHDPDNGLISPPPPAGDGITPVDTIRDCSPGPRVFTNEAGEVNLFPHELGHAGFQLFDEYCCDGGYFQTPNFPNVFMTLAACQADPLYSANPAVCDGYEAANENPNTATPDFFVGDPSDNDVPTNDLMNNNQTPQAADIRRIDWVLNTECPAGRC